MKIDGRCHCGCITYEAEIDPDKVMICHCTDCQTLSGSRISHGCVQPRRYLQTAFGRPQDLRQDERKRDPSGHNPLPQMRNADLFHHSRRGGERLISSVLVPFGNATSSSLKPTTLVSLLAYAGSANLGVVSSKLEKATPF